MEKQEIMDAFLVWLGGDRASGANEYETVRRRLILLFQYRGCHVPEELTDETIDRTARAITKPDFQSIGAPSAYLRGVARNVYYEWLRKHRRLRMEQLEVSHYDTVAPAQPEETEDTPHQCLENCMNALSSDKRSLIVRYYQNERKAKIDNRELLAKEKGVGLNALRIQVFRIRNSLRKCVEGCKSKLEMEAAVGSYGK